LASIGLTEIDTLMVGGGTGADSFAPNDTLIQWIAAASKVARRTCSVCNGAFLLAAAGVLQGRRATTHWCEVDKLKTKFPDVTVELDPIYVRDGNVWTSAGMTAGIDLALALIEEDHGRSLSLSVAKELVVFLHRPGGQTQFSSILTAQARLGAAPVAKLADLPAWVISNLDTDLSVESLARFVGMSPRTFARNFARWHEGTPARFVEALRIEAVCRHLEEGDKDIKRIAELCGFGDQERSDVRSSADLAFRPPYTESASAVREVTPNRSEQRRPDACSPVPTITI
jgi:transcriptional regulator GlxA family with amidase domain